MRIAHDSYGHLRLAEVDLAYILKTLVEHRFASRGATIAIVHKNIGYELRSAAPIAFDCEYVRTLGYGAVEFLLNPERTKRRSSTARWSALINGKLEYLDFASLQDPNDRQDPRALGRHRARRLTRSRANT